MSTKCNCLGVHDLSCPNHRNNRATPPAGAPDGGENAQAYPGGCHRRPGDLAYVGTPPAKFTFDSRKETPDQVNTCYIATLTVQRDAALAKLASTQDQLRMTETSNANLKEILEQTREDYQTVAVALKEVTAERDALLLEMAHKSHDEHCSMRDEIAALRAQLQALADASSELMLDFGRSNFAASFIKSAAKVKAALATTE